MTMPTTDAIYDSALGYYLPPDVSTWTTASTWDDFTQWAMQPGTLIYALDPVDLLEVKTFGLKIETNANGLVSYRVFTSNTGAFAGEETITEIDQNETGISAFTGKYLWIEVTVEQTAGINALFDVKFTVVEKANKFVFNNVNSSTLAGTISARQLPLPKAVSAVTNIQITPQSVPDYQLDVYVTDTPTCNYVVPRVISKGGTPTFALVGLDNKPRDAVIDIIVEYLPEGYMQGNNLLVR